LRTFVVGDIHGHATKLRGLMPHLEERAQPGDALVFVGDYIDRGPDSRGVVDMVLGYRNGGWDGPVVTLKGNHEELMLDFMEREPRYDPEIWIQNGGFETADSYTGKGITRRWAESIPTEHLEFFFNLRLWHEDENGIYVHAGMRPGVLACEEEEDVLLWIRDPFIHSAYRWGKVVVFGHTPQFDEPKGAILDRSQLPWRPLNRPEKIGIDTGAAYGGPLTAVILPDREFVSVR
jgi:serine/threonine protein phosphatase 1